MKLFENLIKTVKRYIYLDVSLDSISSTIELWIGNFFNLMISSVFKILLIEMIN